MERDLRDAVKAAVGEGEWVRLPTVRDAMQAKGYSREEQDAALVGLATQPDVRVIKIANLKSLSEDDHRAGVLFGGEEHHAIMVGVPEPEPAGGDYKMTEQQRRAEIAALSDYQRTLTPGSPDHARVQAELDRLRASGPKV